MITKAIIEQIESDGYHAKVRIPIFHKIEDVPGSTPFKELPTALISYAPGIKPNFSVGDVVYVAFENDQYSEPVIIGALLNDNYEYNSGSIITDSIRLTFNVQNALNDLLESTISNNYNISTDISEEEYNILMARLDALIYILTQEGNIISFDNLTGEEFPLLSLNVEIDPHQDLNGYDYPWIGGAGKNLSPATVSDATACISQLSSTFQNGVAGGSFSVNGDTITITRLTKDYAIFFCVGQCKANEQMTLSFDVTEGYVYDIDVRTLPPSDAPDNDYRIYRDTTVAGLSHVERTFTTEQDGYVYIEFYNTNSSILTVKYSNIQLEKGSTATAYEPYENICPINGWEEVSLYVSGQNLFDSESTFLSADGWQFNGEYYYGNSIELYNKYGYGTIPKLPTNLNEQVTISFDAYNATSQISIYFYIRYTDGTSDCLTVDSNETTPTHHSLVTKAGKVISYFSFSYSYNVVVYIKNFMITIGNKEVGYVPYNGDVFTKSLLIDNYCVFKGVYNLVDEKITLTALGRIFNGTEQNWSRVGSSPYIYRYTDVRAVTFSQQGDVGRGCSHFRNGGVTTTSTTLNRYGVYTSSGNSTIFVQFKPDSNLIGGDTLNNWKTWVAEQYSNGTPLTCWYQLITPMIISLPFYKIKTLLGKNVLWSELTGINGDKVNAGTEVIYLATTQNI